VIFRAYKALLANKLKTTLVYFSLVFAIVSIFLITAIANGVIGMYASMIKTDADIIVTQAKISDTFFSNVDIKLLDKIKKISGIQSASAMIVGASPVEDIPIVAVFGVTNDRMHNYKLISGRYPHNTEVIVGKNIYKQLDDQQNIEIADQTFKISGTYESRIGFENGGVVLTIHDGGEIFNKSASMFLIKVKIGTDTKPILKQIKSLSNKIAVKTTDSFVQNYNQFKIIEKSSWLISLIAFAMGLLSIASIMGITANERESEFGIQKALGIPTSTIVYGLMIESLMIGIIAYICAFIIAELSLYVIKHSSTLQGYVNGEILPQVAIWVFVVSMMMSILGTLLPIFKVSKIDPIILIQGGRI